MPCAVAHQDVPRVHTYACFFFGARKFAVKNGLVRHVGRHSPLPELFLPFLSKYITKKYTMNYVNFYIDC